MDRKWWTLLAVCAGVFMLLLDVTIVTVSLPEIQTSLHASFGELQWVLDAYALALASLLLTSGVLADRYGRRRLFAAGIVIFTLGSLICGLAQSPLMLIASRAGQGVGGAIMFATSLALLGDSFRGADRGIAFGIWGAISGVAVSAGPILGGAITSGINWRGIFLVNVPVGVGAFAVTLWKVGESRAPRPGRPDWPGFALLTAGLISLVYGLIRAGETSWGDATVRGLLIAGGVLLAAFIVAEARSDHPMFDLSLLRIPTFCGGSVAALAMNGSLFAMLLYLVLYLQDVLGYSAFGTGLRLLVTSGAQLVAAAVAGRLSERVPVRWLIGPGLALTGAGLLLMTGLSGTSSWTHLVPGLALSGVGAGLVNPPLASTAIGVVAPRRAGMASGVNSTFRQIGFAAAVAVLGSIFATAVQRQLRPSLVSAPALAHRAPQLVTAIRAGHIGQAVGAAPPGVRGLLGHAIRSSFAGALDDLLVVAGVIALVGAVGSFVLIRSKDFVDREQDRRPPQPATARARVDGGRPDDGRGVGVPPRGGHLSDEPSAVGLAPVGPAGNQHAVAAPLTTGGTAREHRATARPDQRSLPGAGGLTGVVRGSGGTPLGGAAVTIMDAAGTQVARDVTADDGRYNIQGVRPGAYTALVIAPHHRPMANALAVAASGTSTDFTIAGAGAVYGVVRQAAEAPVAGASVILTDAAGRVAARTVTGTDGGYQFGDVPEGGYTITARTPRHQPAAVGATVAAGARVRADVALTRTATLAGMVRQAVGGAPLAGAGVAVADATGWVVARTVTGSDGRYEFTDLPAGSHTVVASGFHPVATPLTLAAGQRLNLDLTLGQVADTTLPRQQAGRLSQ